MKDQAVMAHRKAVKVHLIQAGFKEPQLYYERMMSDTYASYWGDGLRRIEAYCAPGNVITAYELAFIGKS